MDSHTGPSHRTGFKPSPIKKSENPFNPLNFNERKYGRIHQPWGTAWKTSSSTYGKVVPHKSKYNFSTLDDKRLAGEKKRDILRDSVWDVPPRTDSGKPMTPTSVLRYRGIVPHEQTADFELLKLPEPLTRQQVGPTAKVMPHPPDRVFMQRYQRPIDYDEIRYSLKSEHLENPATDRRASFSYQNMGNPSAPLFSRMHPRY